MTLLDRTKELAIAYRRAAEEQYREGDPMHTHCKFAAAVLEDLVNQEIAMMIVKRFPRRGAVK